MVTGYHFWPRTIVRLPHPFYLDSPVYWYLSRLLDPHTPPAAFYLELESIYKNLSFSYSDSSSSALTYLQKRSAGSVSHQEQFYDKFISNIYPDSQGTPVPMFYDKSWGLILQIFYKRLWREKIILLFPEIRVTKKIFTRVAAKNFFYQFNWFF